MTAFVRAFVICDGCGQPLDTSTVPSARNISEALRDAKRDGWSRKGGRRDLCQGCAEPEPTPLTARPKITDLYAENASPDSIRTEIKKARATRDQWQRHVDGLGRLLDTRLGQIDAGTWPPTATEEPTR